MSEERPPLIKGKTKCGRCSYFKGMHPKLLSSCSDVYDIDRKSTACEQFTVNVDPEYYRRNPSILKYNGIASDKYEEVHLLIEEVRGLAGSVFTRSETRSGKKEELRRVREVLRKQSDTSALIPFYEEVQAKRDRVSEIQSLAIQWEGELEIFLDESEAYIMSRFPETRTLKPEAVRKSIVRSILSEVNTSLSRVRTLHKQCDMALRNFSAQHNALIEIGVSARTPVNIPKYAMSEMKREGSFINRKKGRKSREPTR